MGKKTKNKFQNIDELSNEGCPSIQFKRKKMKYYFKVVSNILSIVIISGISGGVFSHLITKTNQKKIMDEVNYKLENEPLTEYSKLIEKVRQSVVTISDSEENLIQNVYSELNSTGVIIDSSGKVIVNYSKVKNMKNIYVKLPSIASKPFKGELIEGDNNTDIAIVKIESNQELTPISFACKTNIVEGQKAVLISNSTGDDYIDNIIPGVVTATNRKIVSDDNSYKLLELNIPITPINTGGIIINSYGQLIGIASYKMTKDMNQNGLYYAITIDSLKEVINSADEIRNLLGVAEGGFINGDRWPNVGGFYVAAIKQDAGSNATMLKPTDIIFEIDGEKVVSTSQVSSILKNTKSGNTLKCKIMRSGRVMDLEIKLDDNKE